jgi:hypothetical protein
MQQNIEEIQPVDTELVNQFLIDHVVNFLPPDQLEELLKKCDFRIESIDARIKKLCELSTETDKSLQLQLSKLGTEKKEIKILIKAINQTKMNQIREDT